MADTNSVTGIKIKNLTILNELSSDDILLIEDDSKTKQTTLQILLDYLADNLNINSSSSSDNNTIIDKLNITAD